jgi:predicted flavoprotein YhiN
MPFVQGYPRGRRELLGPMTAHFGPKETRDWFISKGVSLKTERDGRVFPTTDRSSTIAEALQRAALEAGVQVLTGVKVVSVTQPTTTGTAETSATNEETPHRRRFAVTYQCGGSSGEARADMTQTVEGTGAQGSSGAVLRSKRSSLYEGLGSEDYAGQGSEVVGESGIDSTMDSADSKPSRSKETKVLECDRVIIATGSSRYALSCIVVLLACANLVSVL